MGEIMLHGDCLVNRATELHRLFLHLLSENDDRVEVDLSATGRCDISFFQIICAASRSFARNHKKLALRNRLSSAVAEQFEKAGLAPICSACDLTICPLKEARQA